MKISIEENNKNHILVVKVEIEGEGIKKFKTEISKTEKPIEFCKVLNVGKNDENLLGEIILCDPFVMRETKIKRGYDSVFRISENEEITIIKEKE